MNTLTQNELAETEGGLGAPELLVIFVTAVIGGIVSNGLDGWPEFKQGFREGFASTAN